MTTENEKTWIEAWRLAGPKLQQIRDEELRQMGNKGVGAVAGHTVYESCPHRNGMVTMQAWFQRFQILATLNRPSPDPSKERDTSGPV